MKPASNPFEIIRPENRWAPSQGQLDALNNEYEKLLPPLVHKIRTAVSDWRENNYTGASLTSIQLLKFWFDQSHLNTSGNFRFFFSQREAIESVIYLYEVARALDKHDLMRFDGSGRVSGSMFSETWTRYLVKMATGSGKTKVLGLVLVWSYFHKLYESQSQLSQNFLVIAPNIIVLNRLRKDFNGLKMFFEEPFIPDNGYLDKDWRNDFQPSLHIQDELKPISEVGNIFLTNIHRVHWSEITEPSIEETFLGVKPKPDADTSKGLDLGKVLRSDQMKDLVILNDEAHHIHDPEMQWFRSIADISNKLKLKTGKGIPLQVDFSATPRHDNGAIFVQTICDYPLVEAIRHGVVKQPVLPDGVSRQKLKEKESTDFVERYGDFIRLGYIEWEKQFEELNKVKTPIFFVMTQDTKEADKAADYLESQYPKLKDKVLVIHTNNNGIVKESSNSKKDKEELDKLRKAADEIDKDQSQYRAVVSVLMLREGWDVKNVTTIVGLRPYNSPSDILPEQTIGRGLRKMFSLDQRENLVVIGTEKFMEAVEKLKTEGVTFQESEMGQGTKGKNPIIVEVDENKSEEELERLDIKLPVLSPRIYREYKNLELIDISKFKNEVASFKIFNENELKEIVFTDIDGVISHKTIFTDHIPDYRNVVGFFTKVILKESRLLSGFNILYEKVESFVKTKLFGKDINLSEAQTIRNLSEAKPKEVLYSTFKKAIDELTITDRGTAEVKNYISLKQAKYKIAENQPYLIPKKSVFNKIITDNPFEMALAAFLERCPDIISFAKNTMGEGGINFSIEYQKEDGGLSSYYPDFFIKRDEKSIIILETKGRQDLDDIRKIKRLQIWCEDMNKIQDAVHYEAIYVKQEKWEKYEKDVKSFAELIDIFKSTD